LFTISIGDAGLKDLPIKLDELRGYDETKIKTDHLVETT
jgi:hypothetical protein